MPPTRKEYKQLVVVLRIYDAKTENMESEATKTIDSKDRREWISKTVVWATMNGKYVDIINKEDDNE